MKMHGVGGTRYKIGLKSMPRTTRRFGNDNQYWKGLTGELWLWRRPCMGRSDSYNVTAGKKHTVRA